MTERKLAAPPLNAECAPFYQAAAEGRFLIRRCTGCHRPHWYPRALCPFCLGETAWEEASGRGSIYSFTVMRRTSPQYAVAYVALEEGPRMLTNLVGCDFDRLAIGQAVRLVFMPSEGGPPVPCFTPVAS